MGSVVVLVGTALLPVIVLLTKLSPTRHLVMVTSTWFSTVSMINKIQTHKKMHFMKLFPIADSLKCMVCKGLMKSRAVSWILSPLQHRLHLSAHLVALLLAQLQCLLRLPPQDHLLAQPLPHLVTLRQAQLLLQLRWEIA